MISAFGVDHGYEEIEKFGLASLGTKIGGGVLRAGQQTARGGAGLMRSARPGAGKRMNAPGKMNKPMNALGSAGVKTGGAVRRAGAAMQRNPGATGGVALGTVGAAGAGATGAMMNNRRRF